jgi:hypothetical protein
MKNKKNATDSTDFTDHSDKCVGGPTAPITSLKGVGERSSPPPFRLAIEQRGALPPMHESVKSVESVAFLTFLTMRN